MRVGGGAPPVLVFCIYDQTASKAIIGICSQPHIHIAFVETFITKELGRIRRPRPSVEAPAPALASGPPPWPADYALDICLDAFPRFSLSSRNSGERGRGVVDPAEGGWYGGCRREREGRVRRGGELPPFWTITIFD